MSIIPKSILPVTIGLFYIKLISQKLNDNNLYTGFTKKILQIRYSRTAVPNARQHHFIGTTPGKFG